MNHSNRLVVKGGNVSATREIEIEASPQEVWEALIDEDRRAAWLDEPERVISVTEADAPRRIVWQWWDDDRRTSTVEINVVGVEAGARVVVTETRPSFPLALLASSFALVAA
jgi:uncharacterized protein YndB with AHSA1/START domain